MKYQDIFFFKTDTVISTTKTPRILKMLCQFIGTWQITLKYFPNADELKLKASSWSHRTDFFYKIWPFGIFHPMRSALITMKCCYCPVSTEQGLCLFNKLNFTSEWNCHVTRVVRFSERKFLCHGDLVVTYRINNLQRPRWCFYCKQDD